LNCYCQLSSSVIFRQYGVSQSECKIDRPRPGLPRVSPCPHTEVLGTRLVLFLFYSCVTRMYLCVTRIYSCVTRMLLYVLVCYSYVTRMYSYVYLCVTCMLLVCYSYVLVWCFSHNL
jgi:hypothetical protein